MFSSSGTDGRNLCHWLTPSFWLFQIANSTTITNGEVSHSAGTKYSAGRKYSAHAPVKCDAGYEVEVTAFLVCLETGLWAMEHGVSMCNQRYTLRKNDAQ